VHALTLMPHQIEGVAFLKRTDGRALIADDPGLGKSATVLSYLKKHGIRTTIVTTKSFLHGWKYEASLWWPEAKVSLYPKFDETADVFVTTYDQVWRKRDQVVGTALILDESHKVMNPDSNRSEACRELAKQMKHVVCLSGTPQPNGQPHQLHHQLLLVYPKFLPRGKFLQRYCDAKWTWQPWSNGRWVYDYSGASNVGELRMLMEPRFLRRTRELLNLPPLFQRWLQVPVRMRRDQDETWIAYGHRLSHAVIPHARSLVGDILDRGSKCLVFTGFTDVRDALWKGLDGEAPGITADMSGSHREQMVQRFQEDPKARLFFATPQVCAEGITLTAADTVVFVDAPYSPGLLEQAMSRAYRKGQERPVNVYILQTDTDYGRLLRESLEAKVAITEQLMRERLG
jgi:SNF2 family DNA or RNA helicase